jgi:ribosomal protein S18 acetylase RimI-like enzyme
LQPELRRLDLPVPEALRKILRAFAVGKRFVGSEIAQEVQQFLTEGSYEHHTAAGMSVTYLWFDLDTEPPALIGYFSICAASLRLAEDESGRLELPLAMVPVIRLCWFGINEPYQEQRLAPDLLDHAIARAEAAREVIGARLMMADANPEVVGFYEKQGFESAEIRGPKDVVRMWLDLGDLPNP